MNIVIDIRPLMEGKLSGIEVYILQLLRELFKIDQENSYILFANTAKKVHLPDFNKKNVTIIQTKIPNKLLNIGLCFLRRPKLDKLILGYIKKHSEKMPVTMEMTKLDIFFMPDLRPSALTRKIIKITTIHDLAFLHYKKFFSKKTRLWYKLLNPQREIKTSDHLIAVSSYTKKDVMETCGIPGNKITVIHEAVEESFGENLDEKKYEHIKRRYGLPEKYYLFLSTIEPRKNIQNLVRGFIIYKRLNPNDKAKLVIGGSKNNKIFSNVMHDNHPDIFFTGFIDEEDKAAAIQHADVFIYPSFFEGFGLPLLEAMKCGTPIITSNTSSMPEVVGDAAILINPELPDTIAAALEKIRKPGIKEQLKKNMEKQIEKFSWKKCARETLKLFEETAKKDG